MNSTNDESTENAPASAPDFSELTPEELASRSDEELMARTGAGDASAFEILVDRHSRALIKFFYQHTWSHSIAEDLAQDCFIRIFQASRNYEPKAKFTTWMYRVARNLWIDHLRRHRQEKNVLSLDSESDEGATLVRQLPGNQLTPDEIHSRSELADEIVHAIDQLSEDHKDVLLLSVLHDMKYAEISEVLDIPVGTVKSRMFHCVLRLKELLGGTEFDPRRLKG